MKDEIIHPARQSGSLMILVLLGSTLLHAAPGERPDQKSPPPRPKGETEIGLTTVKVQQRLLPGWGVSRKPGETAWQASIGKQTFLFFDLEGDGKLSTDGMDGLSAPGIPFVVQLPQVLLTASGQFTLSFTEGRAILKLDPILIPSTLLADAAALTEIRLRAGLPPVRISQEASGHCALHGEYLRLNPGLKGNTLRNEVPGRPGYTEDGARAAKESLISTSANNFREALWRWHASAWSSYRLVDPTLVSVGIASPGIAMLYCYEHEGDSGKSFFHPADGAIDVPLRYHPSTPNPVPGTANGSGCGFPVLIWLGEDLQDRELREAILAEVQLNPGRGTGERRFVEIGRVRGTFSSPHKPAHPDHPKNYGLALFVPSAPLKPETAYRTRFVFDGVEDPVEWSFRTGRQGFLK